MNICLCIEKNTKLPKNINALISKATIFDEDNFTLYLWNDQLSTTEYYIIIDNLNFIKDLFYFLGWDGIKATRIGTLDPKPFQIDIIHQINVKVK